MEEKLVGGCLVLCGLAGFGVSVGMLVKFWTPASADLLSHGLLLAFIPFAAMGLTAAVLGIYYAAAK